MNNSGKGFTLIELIVVILVISVVAISAATNLSSTTTTSIYTERDQLISLLRTVQTRAMQNTQDESCYGVAFFNTNIGMLAQEDNGDCNDDFLTNDDALPVFLVSVGDAEDYLNLAIENQYTTTHIFIKFDDLGRPLDDEGDRTGRVTIEFADVEAVCIESEGYIHVCS